MARNTPRYDQLFGGGKFNVTLFIGPDPMGANFDYGVFLEARRRLRTIGLELTQSKRGCEEYRKCFNFHNERINARIRLFMGRNFKGDMREIWTRAILSEDLIYLKTHAGYGRHLSLSDDVTYFTDMMKEGFNRPDRKPYQLYYLDCCKSEMYYKDVFRSFIGREGVDLILNQWFCDYKIISPSVTLLNELMAGSDFKTIVSKMNDEYGIPHFDIDDKPEDKRLDRKMITYSIGDEFIREDLHGDQIS